MELAGNAKTMSEFRKTIAIFYYVVVNGNGIGRVARVRLERLCEEYDFTVFATKFDNPRPDRIQWVRIPCILRPGLIPAVWFRIMATFAYLWQSLVKGRRFDLVQSIDASFGLTRVDIAEAHFCQRYYLRRVPGAARSTGVREFINIAAKSVMSLYERRIYRKAIKLIVPSQGLLRELAVAHGIDEATIGVLAPPVNAAFREPDDAERVHSRRDLGLAEDDVVLLLVSAGDYARKGLAPLIEALCESRFAMVKLFVVGGMPGPKYRRQVIDRNLQDRVLFRGRHDQIQQFFWAADAFILPSKYEVFPAVTIEAACCGLPLITTPLSGVEEYAIDGFTGFTIKDCSAEAIAGSIDRFLQLPKPARRQLGRNASESVRGYGMERFLQSWNQIYSESGRKREKTKANVNTKTATGRAGALSRPSW